MQQGPQKLKGTLGGNGEGVKCAESAFGQKKEPRTALESLQGGSLKKIGSIETSIRKEYRIY